MKKILFLTLISFNSLFAITYSECTSDFSDDYYVFDIGTRYDYYSYSLPSCDYEGWLSVTNPCSNNSYYREPFNFQYNSDSGECTWAETSYSFSNSATPYCATGTIYDYDSSSCISDAPPPTCSDTEYLDTETNTCVTATSIEELDPDGDYDNDGVLNSDDIDTDGDGVPDSYDDLLGDGTIASSSSTSELLTCTDLEKDWQLKLNCFDNKIFEFSCSTSLDGVPYVTNATCKEIVDPCVSIKEEFSKSCVTPMSISGDCVSDGLKVVSNTLSCDSSSIIENPCDIAYDNLKITCSSPSYVVGKCMDSFGTIISNTLECFTPDEDNETSSTSSVDGDVISNSISSNTDKVINHLTKIEENTLDTSNTLKSIDSKISSVIATLGDDTLDRSMDSSLSSINDNTRSSSISLVNANSKLDTANDTLKSIDEKVTILSDVSDLVDDSSSISDSLYSSIDDGFNKYFNLDYTDGLDTACPDVPTLSATVYGKTITIFSQDQLNKWPMETFRTMVIFMFVFSGVIIAFRSN